MADVSAPFPEPRICEYPVRHVEAAKLGLRLGPRAAHASELIWPSLKTPRTDTECPAGEKPAASFASMRASPPPQPRGRSVKKETRRRLRFTARENVSEDRRRLVNVQGLGQAVRHERAARS